MHTVSLPALLALLLIGAPASAQPRATADSLVKRADAKFDRRDLGGAIADYTKAIELDPRNAEAFFRRGLAWTVREDEAYRRGSALEAREASDRAIRDFGKAIERNARLAAAYAGRGVMLLSQGKHAEAERDFARGLSLDPGMKELIDKRVDEIHRRRVGR